MNKKEKNSQPLEPASEPQGDKLPDLGKFDFPDDYNVFDDGLADIIP